MDSDYLSHAILFFKGVKEWMQKEYHTYNGKTSTISDDFRNRKLLISVIDGLYTYPEGWLCCIEGTPVRGKLFIPSSRRVPAEIFYFSSGRCKKVGESRKYYHIDRLICNFLRGRLPPPVERWREMIPAIRGAVNEMERCKREETKSL